MCVSFTVLHHTFTVLCGESEFHGELGPYPSWLGCHKLDCSRLAGLLLRRSRAMV
tara:strand:+ start:992 stop:1156 length:165 start_codon:yes stop_codon:yes gene_type:complete